MSIVPVNTNQRAASELWDQAQHWDDLFFQNFPVFPSILNSTTNHYFPSFGGEIFGSLETHVGWKETQRAHVFRAVFNRAYEEDVLVYIDDENMLQISTEDGKFMTKFKLPEDVKRDEVKASMVNGVLTITVPKQGGGGGGGGARTPNVRSIEISGSG